MDYYESENECPICSGEGAALGTLGALQHWRCRNCGWAFHTKEQDCAPLDPDCPEDIEVME